MEQGVPDVSVLINGSVEDILEYNRPFLEEFKDKRAEKEMLAHFKDMILAKYPGKPFHEGWAQYKEEERIEIDLLYYDEDD